MITINSAPTANLIVLDGNNTVISITSSNGTGHYFRANIYIDDVLFDTQSWSRKDSFTAEKDLKKLYNAYFETIFNEDFTPGVTEQTHLTKKVSITIQEYLLENDSLVQQIGLPDFYIMYNAKPVLFDDSQKVQFLGIEADKYLLPKTGKISIPFLVNTTSETVVITLKDNFNTTIDTQTIASSTAKKVFLYNYDLSDHTFANNTIYFTLTITVGSTTITKYFRYLEFPDFTIKEIAFLNNFGFYSYAYLDGQLAIDNALDSNSYEQRDGTDKTFEVNEEQTYTINSGSLLESEKLLLNQIATALDAKLFYKNNWITIVGKTKKINEFRDNQNNYSENLTFYIKKNASAESIGLDAVDGIELSRILLNNVEVDGDSIVIYFDLVGDYSPAAVTVTLSFNGGTPSDSTGSPISPRTFGPLAAGNYTIWLKEIGTGALSNPLTFTIV